MKSTEDARKYAAERGVSEEESLKKGMEAKAKEFVEKGAGRSRRSSSGNLLLSGAFTVRAVVE